MTLAERLRAITTQLVEEPQNSLFIHSLTREAPGRWADLLWFCDDLPTQPSLQAVWEECGGDLKVAWLSDPDPGRSPTCLKVLFRSKALDWSNLVTVDTEPLREETPGLQDTLQELHAELALEDELNNIIADLVSTEQNALFLVRLFSLEAGWWVDLSGLCRDLPEEERLDAIRREWDGDLNVSWRDDPDSAYGPGYCVILSYSAALHWSNLMIYNKAAACSDSGR